MEKAIMSESWKSSMHLVWRRTRWITLSIAALVLGVGLWWLGLGAGEDLLLFNGWKGTWADTFFRWATRLGEEHPYIALGVVFFFWRRRDFFWIPVAAVIVTLTSYFAKSWFQAPRPGAHHDESWFHALILVDGVRPLTGATSLPSGHTLSAFALAVFMTYLIPLKRGTWMVALLLAVLVGASRVYLVQHFLRDVLLGMVVGLIIGWFLALAHRRYLSSRGSGSSAIN